MALKVRFERSQAEIAERQAERVRNLAMMRLRWAIRANRRSPQGEDSLGYGVRVGYWPCLEAPYIQLALHRWRIEIWYGLPSYLVKS